MPQQKDKVRCLAQKQYKMPQQKDKVRCLAQKQYKMPQEETSYIWSHLCFTADNDQCVFLMG